MRVLLLSIFLVVGLTGCAAFQGGIDDQGNKTPSPFSQAVGKFLGTLDEEEITKDISTGDWLGTILTITGALGGAGAVGTVAYKKKKAREAAANAS